MHVFRRLLVLCLVACAEPALAQATLSVPNPVQTISGPYGVHVVTRGVSIQEVDLVAGPADTSSSLSLRRTFSNGGVSYVTPSTSMGWLGFDGYFTHNFHIEARQLYATNPVDHATVIFDGQMYILSRAGSSPVLDVSVYQDGASFRSLGLIGGFENFELRTRDGTRVIFEKSAAYLGDENGSILAKLVIYPNGEFIVLKYAAVPLPEVTMAAKYAGAPDVTNRLTSVENSRGYGIRFTYLNPATTGGRDIRKLVVSQAQAFVRTCSTPTQCVETLGAAVSYQYITRPYPGGHGTAVFLRTVARPDGTVSRYGDNYLDTVTVSAGNDGVVDYSYFALHDFTQYGAYDVDVGALIHSVTDSLGRVTTVTGSPAMGGSTITLPDGSATTYGSNFHRTYAYAGANEPLISSITDPTGNVTTFAYTPQSGRLVSITYPEGNSDHQVWDGRGNVLEVRRKAKPGTGIADLVATAAFPACSDANFRYCNKPSYVVDARGNRTDFQYDAASGQLTLQVSPPDAQGRRAASRYQYTAFAPADPGALPAGFSPGSLWLLTSEQKCLSSDLTSASTVLAFSCPVGDLVETIYTYRPSTSAAPTSHLLRGVERRGGGATALTCMGHDLFGRRISETAPGAGLVTCP